MVLHGTSEYILSKERVTQGDPLSMLMYDIAVLPLIQALVNCEKWDHNWCADDLACVAKLPRLCKWFERLVKMGPDFRYYPNPQKSIVVVDSKDEAEAHRLFDEFRVTVATGQCFLGSFIGNQEGTPEYVKQKVEIWTRNVEKLIKATESQPRAAHVALTKSLQFEWSYLQRVIPNCAEAFCLHTKEEWEFITQLSQLRLPTQHQRRPQPRSYVQSRETLSSLCRNT